MKKSGLLLSDLEQTLPAYCSKQLLVECDQVRGECVDGGLSGRSPRKRGVDPVVTLGKPRLPEALRE